MKIVEAYFESKLVKHTQRQFTIDFPERKSPSRLTIRRLLQNFRETGRVTNANKGYSGRTMSSINIETVGQHLQESPKKSSRRLSVDLT